MKMKKIIAAALVFALSTGSTVFASAANPTPENNTADIKATYNAETPDPATVYSVDVAWGSLEYTYNSGTTRTWDTETLMFEETEGTPAWSCAAGADTITVTNHSNTGITASFTYGATNDSSISGSFSQAAVVLGAAQENTEQNAAPSGQTTLSLNGALTDTTAVKEEIGQVTVEIGEESGSAHIEVLRGNAKGMDIVLHPDGTGIYTAEIKTDEIINALSINGKLLEVPLTLSSTIVTILGTTYELRLLSDSDLSGDLFKPGALPDIKLSEAGNYQLKIDINTKKWTLEKQ